MVKDFVWRQFLYFTLRNGLYYGTIDPVAEQLMFTSLHKVARVLSVSAPSATDFGNVVVISSLERLWKTQGRSLTNGRTTGL